MTFLEERTSPASAVLLWGSSLMDPNSPLTQLWSTGAHSPRGMETASQHLINTIPSTKPTNGITSPGLNKDERGSTKTPCHLPPLSLELLGNARASVLEHWYLQQHPPPAAPVLPADRLGVRLSRAGREEGVGRELLIEHA